MTELRQVPVVQCVALRRNPQYVSPHAMEALKASIARDGIMGRPPQPLELRRRHGRTPGTDSGGRPLPTPAITLEMAAEIPEPPPGLGRDGSDLWARIWGVGTTWISPDSDWTAALETCRICDDLMLARVRYRTTRDAVDGRMVDKLSERLDRWLAQLGFTPTARSRLGVAEVGSVDTSADDPLAELRKRRESRGA